MLQHPADLVHLSKTRLPAVLLGLLYKLLWGAAVLVDIDDEELLFACELEPITLDGLKRLWTRLAVDLGDRWKIGAASLGYQGLMKPAGISRVAPLRAVER